MLFYVFIFYNKYISFSRGVYISIVSIKKNLNILVIIYVFGFSVNDK